MVAAPAHAEGDAAPEATTAAMASAASPRIDMWLARALLVLALGAYLIPGAQNARHEPVYGPIDEIYHTAYVEQVAAHGLPPVQGKDYVVLGPEHPHKAGDVIIPETSANSAPVPFDPVTFHTPQGEGMQAPVYYYVVAPVTWFTGWYREMIGIRWLTLLLSSFTIGLIYLAVRETAPDQPLAAGLAAIVIGTMTGYAWFFSQVQNDALLMTLSAAATLFFCRDFVRRRSGLWLPVFGGLAAATQVVAAPAAGIGVLASWWRSRRGQPVDGPARRALGLRVLIFLLPLLAWVAFNLYAYHSPVPRDLAAGAAPQRLSLIADQFTNVYFAVTQIYNGSWFSLAPGFGVDQRPAGILIIVFLFSLMGLLASDRIILLRRRILFWIAITALWWLATYEVLIFHAASSGPAGLSFEGRYFCAAMASGAGLFGIVATAPLATFARLNRLAVIAVSSGLLLTCVQTTRHWF